MSQQKTQPRVWTVDVQADEYGNEIRNDCQQAMLEIESIGHRLGGKFYLEPQRAQDDAGLWHTVGWTIAWDSFAPGKRTPAQPAPVAAVPDLEDELTEPVAA